MGKRQDESCEKRWKRNVSGEELCTKAVFAAAKLITRGRVYDQKCDFVTFRLSFKFKRP